MTDEQTQESNQKEPLVEEVPVDETGASEATEVIEGEIVEEGPEPGDELATLRQEITDLHNQVDEYLDDLRRERAAFQNYKRRQENERQALRQRSQAELLLRILPLIDDMQRALEAIPDEQADKPWMEGILLIQRKLETVLESVGIAAIEAEPGQAFDPFFHDAISYEEHEDYDEGEIIEILQQGYQLGERVLRPAMVRVAK